MKTILALMLCIIAHALHSQPVFEEKDWNASVAKAGTENKFLFVDCYTTWCYWCKVMDKQTFPYPYVSQFMKAHFITAKIDMEKGFGIDLSMKYHITGFPTYLFFNPKGELVYMVEGYQDSVTFLKSLIASLQPDSQLHFIGYSKNIQLHYPDFYVKAMKEHINPSDSAVASYLDTQTDLFTEENWAILSKYGNRLPKYAAHVRENRKKYRDLYGMAGVNQFISMSFVPDIDSAIARNDERLFDHFLQERSEYEVSTGTEEELNAKLYFYQSVGNYGKLVSTMEELKAVSAKDLHAQFNDCCWAVYQSCDDSEAIHRATGIMEKIAANNSFPEMDTYASLLFKDKQYDKAQAEAQAAIVEAKKENRNPVATKHLLGFIKAAKGMGILYGIRCDCDIAVELNGIFFPICPSVDTTSVYMGAGKFKDSVMYSNGLHYETAVSAAALKNIAAAYLSLFSIKDVHTVAGLQGKIILIQNGTATPYEARITDGMLSEQTKLKLLQLKKGDAITYKNLYLNDGQTVVPTEIRITVN